MTTTPERKAAWRRFKIYLSVGTVVYLFVTGGMIWALYNVIPTPLILMPVNYALCALCFGPALLVLPPRE